jgi:hypothetical protein
VTGAERAHGSPTHRIFLLSGQGFALGLTTAWIMIPASAIFLEAYGSELLPVTYIGAAVAGVVSSAALAAAFRRRPLSRVATLTLAGLSFSLLASWVVLARSGAAWVSFALLVLIPIVVPVGFIFVVGQAGMLLDVRVLKALYARVVAGFALGFVAGGLAGPALLVVLGGTESLLAAAAVASGCFLALVVITQRRYTEALSVVETTAADAEHLTLRALSRNRYVVLIVAFQMLSAVESQWLDFLVLGNAARRYTDSDELARFISRFSAIAYGADIVFLVVVAGLLLRRFGLRYGLTANAVGVLTLVGAMIVATSVTGSGATLVFVLIVAARVTDLTLSDGTSRTSLSAAYQAVPTRMRAVAQATVEGLAVPVAIGVSGVALLVVQSLGSADGLVLPVLTGIVVSAWVVVAIFVYREYRVNLIANLRGRTLKPADLTAEDGSSLIVIDRLVESEDERDVRLGLDILTIARHPELAARLQRLVDDDRVSVRTDALERLVQVAPRLATDAARKGLGHPSPDVRAASVRVLGAARQPLDLAAIAALSNDVASEVNVAVAVALTRIGIGDDAVLAQVAAQISRLAHSDAAHGRIVAARMLREVEPGEWLDRAILRTLLADADLEVASAALAALRFPEDAELFSDVGRRLDNRRTAAAAVDALVRAGEAALVVVDDGLRGDEHGRNAQESLVHVAREIGGRTAVEMLRGHVEHHDRDVGLAVMRALAAMGPYGPTGRFDPSGTNAGERDLTEAVVTTDLEHATHILRALVAFENEPAATMQHTALHDELDLVRRRILAAFSMRHGSQGFNRVMHQLAQEDSHAHALALEWLDATLTGRVRAAVAILEPRWSDRERLNALMRTFPLPPTSLLAILVDLVEDRDGRWRRPWIKACALYTASRLSGVELDLIAAAAAEGLTASAADGDIIVHETLMSIRTGK